MGGRLLKRWPVVLLTVFLALVLAAPAQATFPGQNGKLAYTQPVGQFERDEIFVSNADGTGVAQLTHNDVDDANPAWSPDGLKIAFERRQSPTSGRTQIWTMNADGSGEAQITDDPVLQAFQPAWSPDGNRIAFVKVCEFITESGECFTFRLATMNADGTGQTAGTVNGVFDPEWSPDGERILFHYSPGSYLFDYALATARPDGTDFRLLVSEALNVESPHWSPDGSRIVLNLDWKVSIMNRDGSGLRQYEAPLDAFRTVWSPDGRWILYYLHQTGWRVISPDFTDEGPSGGPPADLTAPPDWQPIPISAYPRPKGASPTRVSLVPAYQPCTSPDRTHGPPLAFPSCTPTQEPGELTVGSPDANGRPAKSVSYLRVNPLRGDPSTSADEADVRLRATINDVRLRSDLSDYTGDLEARLTIKITDRDNMPHPGGPGAATVQGFTHSHPISCAATADTTVGSTCELDTTVEALVPGAVTELTRAIWELGTIHVHDGAGNLFLTQGVFAP